MRTARGRRSSGDNRRDAQSNVPARIIGRLRTLGRFCLRPVPAGLGAVWARVTCSGGLRELQERRRAEWERDRLLEEVTKRAGELSCMYGVAQLIQTGVKEGDVFRGAVALLPSGWRSPDIAGARICFDGAEHVSKTFAETPWKLAREIVVAGQSRGAVEIFYSSERPEEGGRPIMREETHLIGGIASSLAEMIQRREAEATAHKETQTRAVLAEISRVVSSAPGTNDAYKQVAEQARRLIPFDRIVVTEIDREHNSATDVYVWGTAVRGRATGSSWPLHTDGHGRVAGLRGVDRGAPIVLGAGEMRASAARCEEEAAAVEAGLLSALAVPIIWREEVIGSLNFRSSGENAYSRGIVELAQRISDQIAGAIATSRLHAQALQDAREREVLAEIGRVIGSTLDVDEVYEEFAVQARHLLPADLLTVYVMDERNDTLVAEHVAGENTGGIACGDRFLMGRVAAGDLFPHRQGRIFDREAVSVLADRISVPPEKLLCGFRSIMAVPLLSGDRTIGVLCLRSERDDIYSERYLALAERVGAQIAGAIANSRLHEQAQCDARERSILAEMGRIVTSSLEIGEVYERFADRVRRLIPSDWVIIAAVDLERGTAMHTCVVGDEIPGRMPGQTFSLSHSLTEAVCNRRSGLLLGGESIEEVLARFPAVASTASKGARSAVSVPLISHDSVIGVLHVVSREANAYSEQDLALAEQIGAQIAGAVANADLHAKVQRQSREREVLAEIGRIIGSTLHIDDVYARFAEQVRLLLPFDVISITAVDLKQGTATHAYAQERGLRGRAIGKTIPLAGTLTEAIVSGGAAQALGSENPDSLTARFPGLAPLVKAGARAVLAAPMVSEGFVIGTLQLTSKDPDAYSNEDLALAQRVADQIAGAIANVRLHVELQVRGAALEAAADMIVITDRGGTIEYANQAFSVQTGYSKEEVVGLNPRILKSDRQDPAYYAELWDTIAAGRVWNGTLVNRRKDGSEYPEEMTITPVPGTDGEIARFIAIKRDISQRIRADKERALRRRLDARNRELHRVNEAKSQFLSTVSHELRTPLTSVMAFTDLLMRNRQGNLIPRQEAQLEVIHRNSRRLSDLIKDLLDVSRIDGGRLDLKRADFDARRLVEDVTADFAPILREKGQTLETSVPDGDLRMCGDQSRLAQVISNLLSNASKYSPERSEIQLAVRAEAGILHLEIRDRGVGIDDEDKERLFTPFFRADNEWTRSASGTGLGLVITKAIVDEHGGNISIDSTPGTGTRVHVSIPRASGRKAA